MDAINWFGAGAALVGLAGTSVTIQAGRDVLSMPRIGRQAADWPILSMLAVIWLADLAVTALGASLVLLQL